jgi:branched-subunit amino acid ABC-type transport system permease component
MPFVVIGITTGAVYALASMGLVLTYTTSGVFNFAHGAIGMFATYIFYELRVEAHWPTLLAVAVAVLGVGPVMGILVDRLLLARLEGASSAAYVVVSLGLLVALQGTAVAIFGGETHRVAPIFPTSSFRFAGVQVGLDQTIVVGVAVSAGLLLAALFRRTHTGLKMRAVVGDPELTELMGTDARAVKTLSWMVGCLFAALSGVLFAPVVGVDAVLLTLLVIQAFGAAIVGRLRHLGLTNVGAYGIAILAAISTKYAASTPSLVGLPSSLPFIVLFAVLVFAPKGFFAEVREGASPLSGAVGTQRRFPLRTFVPLVVAAVVVPFVFSGPQLLTATTAVIFVALFSSLGLLVGLSRQVSLCHAVFVVFGATTLSHLLEAHVPYLAALLLGALVLAPLGALVAIPAIRLSGLFLALATFGFGILAESLLYNTSFMFGRDAQVTLSRPALFRSDMRFSFFTLAVVTVLVGLVEAVRVTRLGRIARALGDAPQAVESIGIRPTTSRVMVFALAGFIAGVAGGLLGSLIGSVSSFTYGFANSLLWLTVIIAAGPFTLGGSVLASLLLIAAPVILNSKTVNEWQPVAFGIGAIILAQAPNGLVGFLRLPDFATLARRDAWRLDRRRSAERIAGLSAPASAGGI